MDRGGDVTFHGPGQLVGYPIFDLRQFATPDGKRKTLGAIDYVRRLEEVLIRTCADFSIPNRPYLRPDRRLDNPVIPSEQNNSLANCLRSRGTLRSRPKPKSPPSASTSPAP